MITPRKIIAATAAIACVASVTVPAMAQSSAYKTATVKYDDLNLSSEAGQDRFQARIKAAVNKVCGSRQSATLQEISYQKRCAKTAMESVQKKADVTVASYSNGSKLASNNGFVVVGN